MPETIRDDGLWKVAVLDEKGPGGAHHVYIIMDSETDAVLGRVEFQHGGVADAGVNGVTQECLLAIVAHRLECFQAGPFPSPSNRHALNKVNAAINHLDSRTRERRERGVEGKELP